MLFLIYKNDLFSTIKSSSALSFADDTKCYKSNLQLIDSFQLQQDLNSLSDWSKHWSFFFNSSKFIHLSFNSKFHTSYYNHQQQPNYCIQHPSWPWHNSLHRFIMAQPYFYNSLQNIGLSQVYLFPCYQLSNQKIPLPKFSRITTSLLLTTLTPTSVK